ncbi:MAG: DNA cytosine methyltransferase [Bacillales bacterium]|nr:DNA cytosine methyltransferase [Bacillales bacterium]
MNEILSLFSGVGGIDLAFENVGFKIILANDIDSFACQTYQMNFPTTKVLCGDIKKITETELPDFDCLIGGFPCQAFSIAGYQKGFDDIRGTLFFEVARILKAKQPQVILLENVKNLVSHDNGKTFEVILNTLKELGYYTRYMVLNACEYGNIPQNRERIYIVGFLDEEKANRFYFPQPIRLTKKLSDVIDFENKVDEKFYYPESKFPRIIKEMNKFNDTNTLYQWRRQYVRQNKSNMSPTLTANMGTGGHNVPLIKTQFGVRKLTPKECFNLQGFPKDFILPNISTAQLYKQAGNSVCVTVLERIAKNIYDIMSFNVVQAVRKNPSLSS